MPLLSFNMKAPRQLQKGDIDFVEHVYKLFIFSMLKLTSNQPPKNNFSAGFQDQCPSVSTVSGFAIIKKNTPNLDLIIFSII